jgi:hypothetical protein
MKEWYRSKEGMLPVPDEVKPCAKNDEIPEVGNEAKL